MSDEYATGGYLPPEPSGAPLPPAEPVVLFRHLAEDVAAILDGREPADHDPEPTDAGVHLGTALKFHGDVHDFRVSWDGPLHQLATLTVPWPVASWLQALGVDADPVDDGAGRVSFLLTEAQCHALADRIKGAQLPDVDTAPDV